MIGGGRRCFAVETLDLDRLRVVYPGQRTLRLADKIEAVGITALV